MKIGILGLAHGHVRSYINVWKAKPEMGIELSAAWDHDASRAKFAADKGMALAETPQALLARADVDGVVVASETNRHAELVELAARAGKAIVVQKPLALTLEQADRIVSAVKAAGVPFTVAWQMRADAQNLQIRRMIQDGTIGRVLMVRRRHGLATQNMKDFDTSWHVDPAANRDIWADDAAHPIDFIYWLMGMPVSVTAELASLVNPKVPTDNGIAVFRYAGGAIAEVCCSFVCLAHENTTEVIGDGGVIIQNYGDAISAGWPRPAGAVGLKWLLKGDKDWRPSEIPSPPSHGERISGLAGPLAGFFHGKRPALATAAEGRDVLRMVLACYESSAQGKRVGL